MPMTSPSRPPTIREPTEEEKRLARSVSFPCRLCVGCAHGVGCLNPIRPADWLLGKDPES